MRYLACLSGIVCVQAGTLDELHQKIIARNRRNGFRTTFEEIDTWTEPGELMTDGMWLKWRPAGGTHESAAGTAASAETSSNTVQVVGFSGSVSVGAAAIKSPVFELDGEYFSGDPDAPRTRTYDRDQIEKYSERGLLSLVSGKQPRRPGYVYVYAHPAFVRPFEGACDLSDELFPLALDDRLGAYCAYVDRRRALELLDHWGQLLVSHAYQKLMKSRFDEAKEAAMRARFGATLEHPDLLKRAHTHVAAARLGLGEDVRGVMKHVALDFSKEEADRVERCAHELLWRAHYWKTGQPLQQERFSTRFAGAQAGRAA